MKNKLQLSIMMEDLFLKQQIYMCKKFLKQKIWVIIPQTFKRGVMGIKDKCAVFFLNYVYKTLKHNKLYNTLNYL